MKKEIAIIIFLLIGGTLSVFSLAGTLQKTQLFPSTSSLQPVDEIQDPYIKEQFVRVKQWADKIQQMLDEVLRKISIGQLWTMGDDDDIYRLKSKVGIGTTSPNAPLEVKGLLPTDEYVGGFWSGLFHVTNADDSQFSNSVITGHNSYNTNTQLWYLGSASSNNNNIAFINRQNAALSLWTNNTKRLIIDSNGTLTLVGTARVLRHLQFTMELGRGQSAPSERFNENPYVSYTYGIGDDSHISREVPEDMDFTVASIVKVHWYTTDATANGQGDEVRWEVQWASRAPGEDVTAGDTTANSGDIVCPVENIIVETTVVTILADSIASGDMLGLHIERIALGDGASPTVGSVHILDVELEYTSNKFGKAL